MIDVTLMWHILFWAAGNSPSSMASVVSRSVRVEFSTSGRRFPGYISPGILCPVVKVWIIDSGLTLSFVSFREICKMDILF